MAHYTSIASLPKLIPSGAKGIESLWATPVQFLNDREELSHGLQVLDSVANMKPRSSEFVRGVIVELLKTQGSVESDAFQVSFSAEHDDLGQWRGYASDGMGCSVVCSLGDLDRIGDIRGFVIYGDKKQKAFAYKVLSKLRKNDARDEVKKALVAAASFMKHRGFESEQEYRILKFCSPGDVLFRESRGRLVPYCDIVDLAKASLVPTKVIIGPGWQLSRLSGDEFYRHHLTSGVSRLLELRNLPLVPIEPSSIPYDPR
ncbi:MAG: hypothetical protein AMXMBFR81_00150 [Chthonomonas sp.]